MIQPVYVDGKLVPNAFQIGGQGPSAALSSAPQIPEDQEWKQASPLVAHVPPPTSPARTPAPAPRAAQEPRTGRALVAELRARLRVVEREIRARKKLEAERDSLQRLIAAAKAEPNNVRRIRAAG